MEYEFRPIDAWPQKATANPMRARFRVSYTNTIELLERELEKLRAKLVVIQLDLELSDIRLDGRPRANARPKTPRVILAFESKYGPLKYATDTFDQWQDNLRAIALSLEALRKVDRYGVTKRGEQYKGWNQLPAGSEGETDFASHEEAAQFIAKHSSLPVDAVLCSHDHFKSAYREASMKLHPDQGGKHIDFVRLQKAKETINAYFQNNNL